MTDRRRRGRRRPARQAGHAVARHPRRRAGPLRAPDRRLPGERRVRPDRGGRPARLDRSPADPPRGRRPRSSGPAPTSSSPTPPPTSRRGWPTGPTDDRRRRAPPRRPARRAWSARAEDLFPGGVNSPVRAFRSVGRPPVVLAAGAGARVRDADGRWYVDYIGAWGPAILGHAHPVVVDAVRTAALDGFALGATSPAEVVLGEAIRAAVPSMERLRFTSSGTEAAMSALRLARGATGRDLVVKFAGGYHGHSDGLLVEAGSGLATLAMPGSAGVPAPGRGRDRRRPDQRPRRRPGGLRSSIPTGSRPSSSSRSPPTSASSPRRRASSRASAS